MLPVRSVKEFRNLADKCEQLRRFNDDDIVVDPENRGMSKAFEARRDLSLLIENTRLAYLDSLQTPEDRIDEALRARLNCIFSILICLSNKKRPMKSLISVGGQTSNQCFAYCKRAAKIGVLYPWVRTDDKRIP